MNIPISKPYFDAEDEQAIIEPLKSGWVVQGPFVKQFEAEFSRFTHIPFALSSSNCTTALHLGLEALGIKANDKVIVPSFTYVASANAIEYTRAIPVFCDIDLKSFNLDINMLKKLLQSHSDIKAIMPVHLFGLCANMIEIMELAKMYDLKVIEDAACAFDAWIDDKHSGSFGDCGCFSFHPRKAISTGEGGMLVSACESLAMCVQSLRDHGASKSDLERHEKKGGSLLPDFNMLGYNYRLTDFQGALGVTQMKKAKHIMQARRRIAKRYDEALKDCDFLALPSVPKNYTHGYQSYVTFFGGEMLLRQELNKQMIDEYNQKRNIFMRLLEEQGIATRQGTHAVHTLGYYRNKYQFLDEDFLMSYAADRLSLSLPLYSQMSDEEFNYVIDCIKKGF